MSRTNEPAIFPIQSVFQVPFLAIPTEPINLKEVSAILDAQNRYAIAEQPWLEFSYQPLVTFSMAHANTYIYLKYYVTEEAIRAQYNQSNDPVYKDSCVEFFISFNGEKEYYNLEFNSLGTCLAGFGPNRNNRILLSPDIIGLIQKDVVLVSPSSYNSIKNFHWQLTLAIPVQVFSEHFIPALSGVAVRANFYKCGDELPRPHYLAWNNIQAPAPDFHLPEYFGQIQFL